MKKTLILSIFIILSCSKNKEIDISLLNGYWEIQTVTKSSKLLKTYPYSGIIDFFETDGKTGIRKKVSPKLNGKFTVSLHQIDFTVIKAGEKTYIEYIDSNNIKFKETIEQLDSLNLYISNKDNYKYHYKLYEQIIIDE